MFSSDSFIKNVTLEFKGTKLIGWLKKLYPNYSYFLLCKLIRKGVIRINGGRCRANQILNLNDNIKVPKILKELSPKKQLKISNEFQGKIKSWIHYRDEDIIIINKPYGIPVQGGINIKISIDSILDTLIFDMNERPRIVHRLDKETSGLMIIARNKISAQFYTNLFKKRLIKKSYISIVHGQSKKSNGVIKSNIVTNGQSFEASTFYQTIDSNKYFSLLLVTPYTGRKHQIRKHLLSINLPVVGDRKYYSDINKKLLPQRLNLHAHILKFKNIKEQELIFRSEIPKFIKENFVKFQLAFDKKKIRFDSL